MATQRQSEVLAHLAAGGTVTRYTRFATQHCDGGTLDGQRVRNSTLDALADAGRITADHSHAPWRLVTSNNNNN